MFKIRFLSFKNFDSNIKLKIKKKKSYKEINLYEKSIMFSNVRMAN